MSTSEDTIDAPERGEARPGGGYDRPKGDKGKLEVYSWLFMRISGLILIFLALYHLIWWNLIVGVEHLDANVVQARWSNLGFRLFNVALITFAMLHGLNGVRYSIEDYIHKPGTQKLVKRVVFTIVLLALAFGIVGLLAFDPQPFLANR